MLGMQSLGTCPIDSKHQVTQIHASREGYEEYCCQCAKWRRTIDLRPIRAELREMGVDPDFEGIVFTEGVLEKSRQGEC